MLFAHRHNSNVTLSKIFHISFRISRQIFVFDFFRWAVLLAFDVRIERDAQEHADSVGQSNNDDIEKRSNEFFVSFDFLFFKE